MLKKEFVMRCPQGFHLRPAQVLMETASKYTSKIMLKKNGSDIETEAKSILGLMSLGLENGESVSVTIDGPDEQKTMEAVQKLFDTNFGE
jgi:phosphocarrier protein HPr